MAQHAESSYPASVDGDWTVQVADTIERSVQAVSSRTAVPLTTLARAVVYGFLAAAMGVVVVVLLAISVVRAVNVYLPGPVWSAHLAVGVVFLLAGLLLWSRRTKRTTPG